MRSRLLRQQHRISDIAARVILILASATIALVLVELVARLVLEPPYETAKGRFYVVCDRQVGWRGLSNLTKTVDTDGYIHPVELNSRGMHDTNHSWRKPTGLFRILVLGDSFVEAEQVTEAETAHQVLEDLLNAQAPPSRPMEVISAGVGGWGPPQELMYYRTEGRRYQPDLVVVYLFPGNDLQDALPDARRTAKAGINCYAPYFVRCNDRFDPQVWYSVPGLQPTWRTCPAGKRLLSLGLSWLYAHSRIYQSLEPLIVPHQPRIEFEPMYAPWLDNRIYDETLAYAYDLNVDIYAQLAHEVTLSGAKIVFVLVPLREAVLMNALPESSDMKLPVAAADRAHIDPTLPNRILSQKMESRGLALLDLQPDFVNYLQAGNPLPYGQVNDFHWNVAGNRLAAEITAAWLIQRNLVPGSTR